MSIRTQKGFTLIELLVVIAIIGLLAGIVLVSLSGARNQARDARVVAALTQVRTVAELISTSNSGSYVGGGGAASLCGGGATLNEAQSVYGSDMTTIHTDITTQGSGNNEVCYADADEYCVYASLATSNSVYCIDSTLRALNLSAAPGTCNGTTYTCQ